MQKNTKKNFLNESDDCFSDDFSVSSRRLSASIVPNFEENDDTKEKKANRKSALLENINSVNSAPNNKKFELPSGYTVEQVQRDYGNCIKLASENKINSKNAFDLHLIDYLSGYVQQLDHFQSAGLSLDAGSKIYAGRVDSIHQNTYQVLTGLGNPTDEKMPEADEENNLPHDSVLGDETDAKTKKNKKKVNLNKNTISQNFKKMRINSAALRSEVDPLFQSQAENFDEGGNSELRCNNLKLLDKSFDFLLDSEKVVCTNSSEEKASASMANTDWFEISGYKIMLEEISRGQAQFSEQFEDFIFTGWNVKSEIMNSTTAESFKNMKMEQEIKQYEKAESIAFSNREYDNDDDYGGDHFSECDYNEIMKEDPVAVDDDDDNIVTIGTSKADSYTGNVLMSSVRGLVNSFVEHYGEMNDNMLGMWAGPLYWKQKAKPLKVLKSETVKRSTQNQKPVKEIKCMFPDKIETRLDDNGNVRMVIKDLPKFTKCERPSTQLTDVCLNKNITKDYLLPPRRHFSFQSINHLMNREVSLVNKELKRHAIKLPCSELNDEDKVLSYDYNNANDMLEFCPRPMESLVADDDGNITVVNDDERAGFDDVHDDDDCLDFADGYSGNSFCNIDDQVGELADVPVTANVRRVEKVDIDYAKNAKRINVKNLKSEIWNNLKESINAINLTEIVTHQYPDLYQKENRIMFSDLLKQVDQRLTGDAAKDVSVPIMLTCLLHLSNETGLHMDITDKMEDLAIGQGYSDYDIQQLELFGKGNCLLNESRKRKSVGSNIGPEGSPLQKRTHVRARAKQVVLSDEDSDGMDVDESGDFSI